MEGLVITSCLFKCILFPQWTKFLFVHKILVLLLKVYYHEEQAPWWITDRDSEKHKQVEIDHLLLKTQQLLGYDKDMEEEKDENSLEEGKIVDEEVGDNQSHLLVSGT
ncbi:hypothetical protein MKX03_004474 [Papaver bracteatum]|nr:hypothetical protein MKX03_004474 [Papaver bracteatum]